MKKILFIISLLMIVTLQAFHIEKLPIKSTTYDKNRNPYQYFSIVMKKAKKSGKKILMIVGGDWCKWCGQLDNFFDDHAKIAEEFYGSFEVVRVYYGKGISKEGKSLLRQFPPLKGTPHFYLLNSNSKLLKSIDTAYMERGFSYNKRAVIEFIKKNK